MTVSPEDGGGRAEELVIGFEDGLSRSALDGEALGRRGARRAR